MDCTYRELIKCRYGTPEAPRTHSPMGEVSCARRQQQTRREQNLNLTGFSKKRTQTRPMTSSISGKLFTRTEQVMMSP